MAQSLEAFVMPGIHRFLIPWNAVILGVGGSKGVPTRHPFIGRKPDRTRTVGNESTARKEFGKCHERVWGQGAIRAKEILDIDEMRMHEDAGNGDFVGGLDKLETPRRKAAHG